MLMAAPADGYTLLFNSTSTSVDNFFYLGNVEYKFEDLVVVSLLYRNSGGMITRADRPWNTLTDAIEYAKANNVSLRFGFQGAQIRVAMEKLAEEQGFGLSMVPMSGGPELIAGLLGNHLDLGVTGNIWSEHHRSGTVKGIAVPLSQRSVHVPEVSTLLEQGYNIVTESPMMIAVRAGTPDAIINRLDQVLRKIIPTEEFQRQVIDMVSAEGAVTPGREYAAQWIREAYNREARLFGRPELP
jgi:tripartite-type tricarboxylate transporter receptor subunit TctC